MSSPVPGPGPSNFQNALPSAVGVGLSVAVPCWGPRQVNVFPFSRGRPSFNNLNESTKRICIFALFSEIYVLHCCGCVHFPSQLSTFLSIFVGFENVARGDEPTNERKRPVYAEAFLGKWWHRCSVMMMEIYSHQIYFIMKFTTVCVRRALN